MDKEKEKKAIDRLKAFEPDDGYQLAYSGGKDSDCIKILAQLADVNFKAVHNLTTVDAPETVQYVKSQSDVEIELAKDKDGKHVTMWNLIIKKGLPPTRLMRYCCSELKERSGKGKVVVTGVRWGESTKRAEISGVVQVIGKPKTTQKYADEINASYQINKMGGLIMNDDNDENRRMVEHCYRTTKTMVNPIVDWTDDDVWEFLNHYGCKSNPLYECGFKRVGCVGCPMATYKMRLEEFSRYPTFKITYVKTFDKMLKVRAEQGKINKTNWQNGLDVFRWWLGENINQLSLFDENEEELIWNRKI